MLLVISELFRWEKDREAIVEYLETRAPYVNTEELKAFFKKRSDREVSNSNIVKAEPSSEVNKPPKKKKHISMKRLRSEENTRKRVIDLTEGTCCEKEIFLMDATRALLVSSGLKDS
ncbi:hypothetical protein PIB30_022579 [Stylosanthes scabra]|uniref:Uncharacterized protein n=1 Tax=Stylosanthes scabra TaxID=79078 RepID=A0ABU6Z9H4_9FABA|nr:hypothetical protein [Stylosanthes scabra]